MPVPPDSPEQHACHSVLEFTAHDQFVVDSPIQQIVVATFARSRSTFDVICEIVKGPFGAQAAMLSRALFEDMVVNHWVVLNDADPDWLVDRFFRHRDAMALHQRGVARETRMQLGTPLVDNVDDLVSRQNILFREFGGDARKDWWDPGVDGRGAGRPIGLRGVVQQLEDAASRHERFHPRFAGGQEPLLERLDRVAQKWFTRYLHHTAVGLPAQPQQEGPPTLSPDPSWLVLFVAYWAFSQQIYLLHDLYGRNTATFDDVFRTGLAVFGARVDVALD